MVYRKGERPIAREVKPACAEAIRREATRCTHCSTEVEALPPQIGLFGKLIGKR